MGSTYEVNSAEVVCGNVRLQVLRVEPGHHRGEVAADGRAIRRVQRGFAARPTSPPGRRKKQPSSR
jgi:hypothetical protein